MKKYIFKTLLCLFVLVNVNMVNAQKEWTLEQCIGYALDNNIQIKRQELQSELAKNNLAQSKFDFLPSVGAYYQHQFGTGPNNQSFEISKQTFSNGGMYITANMDIFKGFQKINSVKMNKFAFLSTQEQLEKAKNDISLTIASAYLQILFSNELLEVAKNQLNISNLQVEKTKKLVEVGNLARGALLEIIAQAASDESALTQAQNQLNLSYISLAQILDLDTVNNFKIFIPLELAVPENFRENSDSIYRIALGNLPEIKSFEYLLKSSKYQLNLARGYRFPQITLNGNIGSQYNAKLDNPSISKQIDQLSYQQIGLNLSIPIFTKFQIQKGISNAKINVKDNEFALKQAQLSLRKEVEQAYADALASFKNFQSREESVAAFEENFKYVQQKFDVGLVNTVDYNIAKNNYTKAKSDLLQAKYEFIFKTKIIEFYKGNVIRL